MNLKITLTFAGLEQMQTLWISDSIFSMDVVQEDIDSLDGKDARLSYREWEHAEIRLEGSASIYDKKDALAALNRQFCKE